MIFSRDALGAATASQHGLAINQHGRIYRNGSALSFEQKVAVAVEYLKAKNDANGTRPNISALSRKCHVSRSTVTKVEEELISSGQVIDPKEIVCNRDIPSGPGSKSLSDLDVFVVLLLYHQEPSRTLKSYVLGLYMNTGTLVHKSTISRFFKYGFKIKGSLCKPNLIPYDKFRPENLERALDYLMTVSLFDRS